MGSAGFGEKRREWIGTAIIFVAIYFLILVVRFLLVNDLDFGFSLIVSAVIIIIYILLQRLMPYIRRNEA
jgi:signal transduction histidine kinase